jgi:hypothetical protein
MATVECDTVASNSRGRLRCDAATLCAAPRVEKGSPSVQHPTTSSHDPAYTCSVALAYHAANDSRPEDVESLPIS